MNTGDKKSVGKRATGLSSMRMILATTACAIAVLAVLLWPERIRWRAGGSALATHTKLEPSGLFPITLHAGASISIEGDSLVLGSRGKNEGRGWPQRLQQLKPRFMVSSRGIGGGTAQSGLMHWRTAECVDLAIVSYGTNDAGIRGPLFKRKPVGVGSFRMAMRQIIQRHLDCKAQVVVLAPPPAGSEAMQHRLAPYRKASRDEAVANNVRFLDPAESMATIPAPLQRDGLHLRAAGREAIARFIAKHIAVAR